jgi:hypothetical protein
MFPKFSKQAFNRLAQSVKEMLSFRSFAENWIENGLISKEKLKKYFDAEKYKEDLAQEEYLRS